MAATLEKEIERHLVHGVRDLGGYCLKWVCPGWTGVPDRLVLLPGGRVFFVELKRPDGGQISKAQYEWHSRLRGLGFITVFLKSHLEVKEFLEMADRSDRVRYVTHIGYTGRAFREDDDEPT